MHRPKGIAHFPPRLPTFVPMKTILSACLVVCTLLSCAQSGPSHLAPAQFKAAMDSTHAFVVDVRTPGERDQGFIEGSVNIDWQNGDLVEKMSDHAKDEPVLLYCASGGRSGMAVDALRKAGYTNVHDLAGGMRAWIADKEPVAKP